MVARIPIYLFSLMNIGRYMSRSAEKLQIIFNTQSTNLQTPDPDKIMAAMSDNLLFIILSSLGAILFLIWYITLLYNGFKTASHAKGTKPIILFSVAIILAEIISKLLIYSF